MKKDTGIDTAEKPKRKYTRRSTHGAAKTDTVVSATPAAAPRKRGRPAASPKLEDAVKTRKPRTTRAKATEAATAPESNLSGVSEGNLSAAPESNLSGVSEGNLSAAPESNLSGTPDRPAPSPKRGGEAEEAAVASEAPPPVGEGLGRGSDAFSIDIRPDGVAIVTLDVPGEAQNTLKAHFAEEFEDILNRLEQAGTVRAAVFTSGKPTSFLAGADVTMLEKVTSAEDATRLSERGQRAFDRLAALPIPVVAAIHGPCLGGGLELALACSARILSDDPKTELGLPEVQLGLLPGAGGTQRLPRLIGIQAALDLMLTGRKVKGRKAVQLGLADDVCPKSILLDVALEKARKLADAKGTPKVQSPLEKLQATLKGLTSSKGVQELLLEDNPIGRRVLFQQARKALRGKTYGNYPAPERIIDAVEQGLERGMEEGLKLEARYFGELVVTPQARNLMSLFFATTALKKDSGVDDPTVRPRPVHKVGILGAGLMGAGIAYATTATAGLSARIKDKDDEGVARGLKTVKELVDGRVKRKSITRSEGDVQYHRVTGTVDYSGFKQVEVVIEAVFESVDLKHRMIREIEAVTPPGTIFASNTSSIPITKLAEASSRPETVIGMHYFSPVEKMPLLEIIVTDKTSDEVTATCVELGKKQGKTVIVVRDGVGFYTSRILGPYMNEAAQILSEGVAIETIDRALKQWGFPVGPITLLDEVGIDVAEKVGHIMIDAFGERMTPPPIMQKLVEDGRAGRKNRKGFYTYDGKKKQVDTSIYTVLGITPDKQLEPTEIAERCALLMVNEAMLCYGEGILRSPRDGDIGAIFGLGFPPFRGGPFRYVDEVGAAAVVAKLEGFAAKYGPRFTPAPALRELAAKGGRFHP